MCWCVDDGTTHLSRCYHALGRKPEFFELRAVLITGSNGPSPSVFMLVQCHQKGERYTASVTAIKGCLESLTVEEAAQPSEATVQTIKLLVSAVAVAWSRVHDDAVRRACAIPLEVSCTWRDGLC